MNDCDRRIRCGVSELALEVFDPQFERSKEGRLLAFNKYRPYIESVASAKYDFLRPLAAKFSHAGFPAAPSLGLA